MKSLFNAVALVVRVQTSAMKAAYKTIREEGGVIVNLISDIRQGLEQSDLPAAVKEYKAVFKEEALTNPDWAAGLKEEVSELQKSCADLLGDLEEDEKNLRILGEKLKASTGPSPLS